MSPYHNIFRFSLMTMALSAGFAQAQTTTQLDTINVYGHTAKDAERNTSHLKDVLADQVSVNIGGGGASGQWLTIRGAGESRIDMVVDNTSSTSQLWHHQSRFMFDPDMVKVLGIDKGAGSASAGIGATGGRIRATTVDAADWLAEGQHIGARVSAEGNTNKGAGGSLSVYGRAGGFDALVMGSWSKDRNYKDGSGKVMRNTARDQDNYLFKLGYNISPDHRISVSHRREQYSGSSTMRPEFQNMTDRNNEASYTELSQQTTNLEYRGRNLGFVRDVDVNLFHIKGTDARPAFCHGSKGNGGSKECINETNDKNKPTYKNGFIAGTPLQSSYAKSTGANLNLTSELGQGHLLKYGLNWRQESVTGSGQSTRGEEKNEHGLYTEGIWHFAPITLTTGLRYDYFKMQNNASKTSTHRAKLNPSIGIIYDVDPQLALYAKWNQATRSPQLLEGRSANSERTLTGFKPETVQLAEIGWKWTAADNRLTFGGSLFHQTIKDYINNNGRSDAKNAGKLKSSGYELNVGYTDGNLSARIATSRTYLRSHDLDPLPSNPSDALPVGQQWLTSLSYRLANPNLELGWRGRYAQSVHFTVYNKKERQNVPAKKNGYGVHDIFVNWKPLGDDRMNVNFSVNNVFDKQYRSHGQRISDSAFFETGRSFRLGMNYRF